MTFVWKDHTGRTLELSNPEPIVAEITTASLTIDTLIDLAESTNITTRDNARVLIRKATDSLQRLQADRDRWDAYADAETHRAAGELVAVIDGLAAEMDMVTLVVALHDERNALIDRTASLPTARAAALAAPATAFQRRAMEASAARPLPPDTATRAEVSDWLDEQMQFARGRAVDGGWFTWADHKRDVHQIEDSLPIEREMVAFARELTVMRAVLTDESQPDTLYTAVNRSSDLLERLKNLQNDLKRFECASVAREDTAWSKFAIDWRSKRNTS